MQSCAGLSAGACAAAVRDPRQLLGIRHGKVLCAPNTLTYAPPPFDQAPPPYLELQLVIDYNPNGTKICNRA